MKIIRLALLATLASVAACDLEVDSPGLPPSIYIANGAPHTESMHLHVDGNQAVTAVALQPRGVDPFCPFVLRGTRTFDFVQHDTLYATVDGSLIMNTSYLVVLVDAIVGTDTTYRIIVAGDDITEAPASSNGVRVINGTATAGDVYITAPDEAPSAATRVAANLGPAATSTSVPLSFHMVPTTATRVRLFDVGTTTNPRADVLIVDTGDRQLTTIVFQPQAAPSDQGGFQVNACS